jgi:hypothetical protein
MKKSAKAIELEQRLLASLENDAERKEMQAMLDELWQQSIELARMRVERDRAMEEFHHATRALFEDRRRK